MAAQIWKDNIPPDYSCSVTSDGRIFFINEVKKDSSWLHPVTKAPVQTGHRVCPDLPEGWERGVTSRGIPYYIDHINQQTSLVHPITGESEVHVDAIHSPRPYSPRLDSAGINANSNHSANHQDAKRQATKKSSSLGSWVKGPCLRRPEPSSTTLQGWLLKQGSDGLHLWKRRWFVLSDFCLYYYKSPHDEKVLGYIPLPSFKVRPATSDDKLSKRLTFKLEHENTRTYYFAAESKAQMIQWMNALSLASIMQNERSLGDESLCTSRTDRPSLSSLASSASPDSDSSFQRENNRSQPQGQPRPTDEIIGLDVSTKSSRHCPPIRERSIDEAIIASKLTESRLNTSVDSCQVLTPGGRQPFYANAPPKPRRLNTSYEQKSPTDGERQDSEPSGRNSVYSPRIANGKIGSHLSELKRGQYISAAERRTPEAYGATSTLGNGEYEDIYGAEYDTAYQQHIIHNRESFSSSKSEETRLSEDLNISVYSQDRNLFPVREIDDSLPRNWDHIRRKPTGPPRPHSADFLEYDRRHGPSNMFSQRTGTSGDVIVPPSQQPRPKSSVGYYHEGDFWSEENYAAKMRESAIYKSYMQQAVRPLDPTNTSSIMTPTYNHNYHQSPTNQPSSSQRVPPAGAATPDLYIPPSSTGGGQIFHQQSPSSYNQTGSLKRSPETRTNITQDETLSKNPRNQILQALPYQSPTYSQSTSSTSSTFLRSASARLSRSKPAEDSHNSSFQDDGGPDGEKKFYQREESMKRLLEWKQRMLQSPLTRKSSSRPGSSASSTTSSSKLNQSGTSLGYAGSPPQGNTQSSFDSESYHQQILMELASQESRTQIHQIQPEGPHLTRVNDDPYPSYDSHANFPKDKIPQGGRLSPQGGSGDGIDQINTTGGRSRRDARKEGSRARGFGSSSSKYNSCSSDEQDVVEDRNTRRKSKKSSRRTPPTDQKQESRRHSNSSSKTNNSSSKFTPESSSKENEVIYNGAIEDMSNYVNIDAIQDSIQNSIVNESLSTSESFPSTMEDGCQKAYPVYVNDDESTDKDKMNNSMYSENLYTSCDSYYGSDVQKPSQSGDILCQSHNDIAIDKKLNDLSALDNFMESHEYENTFLSSKRVSNNSSSHSISKRKNTGPKNGDNDNIYCASYSKTNYQDDTSVGKYSDSGYDTLRAEMSQRKEEKQNVDRRVNSNIRPRPETWSPDKCDRIWNGNLEHQSKVDESNIIKEYSYEYITSNDGADSSQGNLRDMNIHSKLSSPNLPSLESPRIVQETQHATNRNLVKDRIKSFSSITEQNKPLEKMYAHLDLSDQQNWNIQKSQQPKYHTSQEELTTPLNPVSAGSRSSEAHVSKIKENYVSSLSTKVHSQEAQVKILSDAPFVNDISKQYSPSTSNNSCSELSSLEYSSKDVRTPQEIMDSRLSRSNIRKFVFEEENSLKSTTDTFKPKAAKKLINMMDIDTSKNDKKSVRELLQNFENKAEFSDFEYDRSECKRKFYSDSELISNESSNGENCENEFTNEMLPPPPPSLLQELRDHTVKPASTEEYNYAPPRPPKKPSLRTDIDCRGRPRGIRLSLTESIEESLRLLSDEEHDNESEYIFSKSFQPNTENIYSHEDDSSNIDLDRPPRVHAPPPPKVNLESVNNSNIEENYLPMSPPKNSCKITSNMVPSSSNSSLGSSKHLPTPEPILVNNLGKPEVEEHTYIEMTGEASPKLMFPYNKYKMELSKLDINKETDDIVASPESPRYYEIGEKDSQHYEYICKASSHYESIYMEVTPSKKDDVKEQKKPKPPQKPSDLLQLKPFHKKCSSDSAIGVMSQSQKNRLYDGSSDADDEASKEFENLKLPRKPRFSLSDTFRPASYYLSGSDPSADLDQQDSSDSDLVSPPPIPLNESTIDENDHTESLKTPKSSTLDYKMIRNSPLHKLSLNTSNSHLNGLQLDHDRSFSPQQYFHNRSDSGSSAISNKIKRRPLIEETLEEYNNEEAYVLRSEDVYPTSYNHYEGKSYLNTPDKSGQWHNGQSLKSDSDTFLYPENPSDNSYLRSNSSVGLETSFDHRFGYQRSSGKLGDMNTRDEMYENNELMRLSSNNMNIGPLKLSSSNSMINQLLRTQSPYTHDTRVALLKSPARMTSPLPNNTFHSIIEGRAPSVLKEKLPLQRNLASPFNDSLNGELSHEFSASQKPSNTLNSSHQRTSSELSMLSLASPLNVNSGVASPVHVRTSSNISNNSETSPRTAPYYYSDVIKDQSAHFPDEALPPPRIRSHQLNNQRELDGNKRQDVGRKVNLISTTHSSIMDTCSTDILHNELKNSLDLFDGKTISIPDERNVYESDTLRKIRSRSHTPDPDSNSKNIYPYGISMKSKDHVVGNSSHRRTRSLEGIVDENLSPYRNGQSVENGPPPLPPSNGSLDNYISKNALYHSEQTMVDNKVSHSSRPNSRSLLVDHAPTSCPQENIYSNCNGPKLSYSDCSSLRQTPTNFHKTSDYGDNYPKYVSNASKQSRQMELREGSSSRMSIHDTFSIGSEDATNWEDDGHWKEQLRRASLRHTKSLENLEDARPRNSAASNSNPSNNVKISSKFTPKSTLCTTENFSVSKDRVKSPDRSLDEYHVDYREGRIPPGLHYGHDGTLDRTRKGLTSLEEYEWDASEEKFKKPSSTKETSSSKKNTPNNQAFLADGLPPTLDREKACQSPHTPIGGPQNTNLPRTIDKKLYSKRESFTPGKGGRLEEVKKEVIYNNVMVPINTVYHNKMGPTNAILDPVQEQGNLKSDIKTTNVDVNKSNATTTTTTTVAATTNGKGKSAPDVIPEQDVNRIGEAIHHKATLANQKIMSTCNRGDSPLSTYSYGFGNGYPSTYKTKTETQSYRPIPPSYDYYNSSGYETDDRKFSNYFNNPHRQYPYSNFDRGLQGPMYENYRNPYPLYGPGPKSKDLPYRVTVGPVTRDPYNGGMAPMHVQDPYTNYSNFNRTSEYYDQAFREVERLQAEEMMLQREANLSAFRDSDLMLSKSSRTLPGTQLPENISSSQNFLNGVSAGELLGKTHEELVLLLIQLRRHQSALLEARKHTGLEKEKKIRNAYLDSENGKEYLNQIATLDEHLQDLEKQYQMGKPLINLVDNMVKLGSLYPGGFESQIDADQIGGGLYPGQAPRQDTLDFSRRILEKRILAEDQLEYDSVTPDQIDLEGKVLELYKLEKRLQQESLTIRGLQREKDMLERTLENLHYRAQGANESMLELERRNLQRDHLERELSRLRSHLAVSARRLEDTATENNRLEHEMMMLRQKIQTNMERNALRNTDGTSEAKHIESEMLRVQTLLEDLQKRRMDLSQQIQHLTSANQAEPGPRASPLGFPQNSSAPYAPGKKTSTWMETDLDTMTTLDLSGETRKLVSPMARMKSPFSYQSRYGDDELNVSDYAKGSEMTDLEYSMVTPSSDVLLASRSPVAFTNQQFKSVLDEDLPLLTISQPNMMDQEKLSNLDSSTYRLYGDMMGNHISGTGDVQTLMDRNAVDNKPDGEEQQVSPVHVDINEADDRMKRYYGILPKEKLEPKTVRIVKRESTERKKDRFPPYPPPGGATSKSPSSQGSSSLTYVDENLEEEEREDSDPSSSGLENEAADAASAVSLQNRCASLPRNYGRGMSPKERVSVNSSAISNPPRPKHSSDYYTANKRPHDLPLKNRQAGAKARSGTENSDKPAMSAHEQLFGVSRGHLDGPNLPPSSPTDPLPPPVFKSDAAKQIINEVSWEAEKHKRSVPKEKRRHYTISSSKPLTLETGTHSPVEQKPRSRDDCDMVRALRPRNHPDVVKSTLSSVDVRFNESTIDTILGTPRKICIPERYIPDKDDEKVLTNEEIKHREDKALAIRKMLTESSASMTKPESAEAIASSRETEPGTGTQASTNNPFVRPNTEAEKREREHMLELNQILAKQVMEKSRVVAAHTVDFERLKY